MKDLYNEELIAERGFRCKDCGKMAHEHTFVGKWHDTGKRSPWGGTESFRYDNKCDENFRGPGVSRSQYKYPNLLLIHGKWYYFSQRASLLALVIKPTVAITVEKSDSLTHPTPIRIDTYGDMYNFSAQQGILEKLQQLVDEKTFKSMQSKSIERAMKKLSS